MDKLTCKNIEGWNVLCDASNFDKNGKVKDTQQCDEVCSAICYCGDCPIQKAINKLADYEDQEEQGLLLKLPFKIGTVLYNPVPYYYKGTVRINEPFIFETKVVGFGIENMQLTIKAKHNGEIREFTVDKIGTTFFLTKEEAEQVLAELKGGQNG